jgi:phosphohistidine phosphatase SixA
MRARPDAIPNAAGCEGGHRAATPGGVNSHILSATLFRTPQQARQITSVIAVAQSASRADGHLYQVSHLPYAANFAKSLMRSGMAGSSFMSASFDWSVERALA